MILEGIVTTLDCEERVNVAPMGPDVDQEMSSFLLKPFKTSTTYQNLKREPCGVFNVVDDVFLLAKAAIGKLVSPPPTAKAHQVHGVLLEQACRWYEFEIVDCDDSQDRSIMRAQVVHAGRLRDFFGFQRAKHAVLEAAILATRVHMLESKTILAEYERLKVPIEKTAGDQEREAFDLLFEYVADYYTQN